MSEEGLICRPADDDKANNGHLLIDGQGGRSLFNATTSLELVTRPRCEDTRASGGGAAAEELEEERGASCRRRWHSRTLISAVAPSRRYRVQRPKDVLQCCTAGAGLGVSWSWIVPGSGISSDATQTRPQPGSMLPTCCCLIEMAGQVPKGLVVQLIGRGAGQTALGGSDS